MADKTDRPAAEVAVGDVKSAAEVATRDVKRATTEDVKHATVGVVKPTELAARDVKPARWWRASWLDVRACSTPPAIATQVSDIHAGAQDAAENDILAIYSKVSKHYAVYLARDRNTKKTRVVIQYADDTEVAAQQRKKMAPLNAKRSEITGLLSNWSDSHFETFRRRPGPTSTGSPPL